MRELAKCNRHYINNHNLIWFGPRKSDFLQAQLILSSSSYSLYLTDLATRTQPSVADIKCPFLWHNLNKQCTLALLSRGISEYF